MKISLRETPLIVLAAGASSRMGMPKGLLPLKTGEKLLSYQIRNFLDYGGMEVVVVLGHHLETYQQELRGAKQVQVVINPDPDRGPFSSLQLALEIIPSDSPAAWILPLDTPIPPAKVFQQMVENFDSQAQVAIPQWGNKLGHPILIGKKFIAHLRNLSPADPMARLDHQWKNLPAEKKVFVPVDSAAILVNINTPQDWERFSD